MLPRNNTTRLGVSRRKSTSSVQSKHEPLDPEVARHHAQAAATLAFNRGQERRSADIGRPGLLRHDSTASQGPQAGYPKDAGQTLRRQQSVRFVGPDGIRYRQSVGSRPSHATLDSKPSSATLRPMAMTTNAPVPAAYRPPSRGSSIGKSSIKRGGQDSYVAATAVFDEYYTRQDDVASTPSSYRRIRKSKSMFAPLKAPRIYYPNGSSEKAETVYSGFETPQPSPSQLRAPKSMSFLRGGRELAQKSNDQAVQLARDRFFHDAEQQRLREQPSFLFRSKSDKEQASFRKSVRSSSMNSAPPKSSGQTHSIKSGKGSGLKDKARKISRNMKNKIKKAFSRNKGTVTIPDQQVLATVTHVREYNSDPEIKFEGLIDVPYPDGTALLRVASRSGSLYEATSDPKMETHISSLTSSSYRSDKSRVTSWNNTSAENTINSQTTRNNIGDSQRELQRLSVINENGTHVSAAAFHRPKVDHHSAYPAVHRPSKNVAHVPPPPPVGVDSARVYSALMKRLDQNSPRAKLEASRKGSTDSFVAPTYVPQRADSANSGTPATIRHVPESNDGSRPNSACSNQHQWVRTDSIYSARAEDAFGYTGTHAHQWTQADSLREARMREEDDVFSPKAIPKPFQEIDAGAQKDRTISILSSLTKDSFHTVQESLALSPQDIARQIEPITQPIIRESRSTFFGGSPSFTIGRTPSPLRRAMATGSYNPQVVKGGQSNLVCNSSKQYQQYQLAHVDGGSAGQNDVGSGISYSESIYSRTTGRRTPAPDSTLSLPFQHRRPLQPPPTTPNSGYVAMIDHAVYQPTMPTSVGHQTPSSTGSVEWKKWMSSEVSKLEKAKENASPAASYINYALPTMPKSFQVSHIRERTQIVSSSDEEVAETAKDAERMLQEIADRNLSTEQDLMGNRRPSIGQRTNVERSHTSGKPPLGLLHQNIPQLAPPGAAILKPILKNRSNVSLTENIDPSRANEQHPPIPPPPPIPDRSSLRPLATKPSQTSLRSENTISTPGTGKSPASVAKTSSMSGRSLLHKRNNSATTLKSVKSVNVNTPAKLTKKNRKVSQASSVILPESADAEIEFRPSSASNKSLSRSISRARTPGADWSTISKLNTPNHNRSAKLDRSGMKPGDDHADDIYGTDGAGLLGPETNEPLMTGANSSRGGNMASAQQIGSKRMVEMFLSSRRRRMVSGSGSDGSAFI
ncbi:hypothetical protein B0O99DRAFT_595743 [Bisporella sp. PMI_857]|nr:hypothetical protein B0O99DRAFT_595743 [Bisporella sp. PMI_857]